MSQLKCFSTGHFFVCFPDVEATFTCYECLQEFATIHVKPVDGIYGDTRKRRSIYGVPVKQNLPRNYTVDDNGEDTGPVDKSGRKRSKSWRCLQTRCKLLACDECSDKLIDPKFVGGRSDGNSSSDSVMTTTIKTTTHVTEHIETKAGDSTPHVIEYQKENQNPALKTDARIETTIKTEIKTETKVHFKTEHKPENATKGDVEMLEADSAELPARSQDSPPKLVYRRATEVGNHALSHFHHRPPGPRMPRASMGSVDDKEKGKSSRPTPSVPQALNPLSQVKPGQPINVSASSSYQPGAPVHVNATITKDGPVLAADSASSDDDDEIADEHNQMEFLTLPVRSARQAANQAMRNMHLKMRERASRPAVSER